MTTLAVAPQTPPPNVRIRSQSFDSPPFLRLSVTPVEESPFSKSTGSLKTLPSYNVAMSASIAAEGFGSTGALPQLNTKASDASMLSEALSASFSSVTTSPTSSGSSVEFDADEALPPSPSQEEEEEQEEVEHQQQRQRQRPYPLAFTQSATHSDSSSSSIAAGPASPFLYQDTSCPMYSPWLVCAVLDMHDVRRLDWMSIADPIERVWGVRTSSADVLGILSDNGRVLRRKWWD